jgi:integrase
VRPSTLKIYESILRLHCGSIDDLPLLKIKSEHIKQVVNALSDKPRAQEKTLITLKAIFNQAIENDYIYKNPAAKIKLLKRIKPKKRALTEAERNEITALDLPIMVKVYVYILLYCGLRRGEAWALTSGDIKDGYIHVNKTGEDAGEPKSQAAIRQIPIPAALSEILEKYTSKNKEILLFHKDGKILTECQLNKMWLRFVNTWNRSKGGNKKMKAIASDITPHLLRHTYATMLYYAGVDIKTAQYLLGHSSVQITLEIYTHLEKESGKTAVVKLDKYLNKKSLCSQKVVRFRKSAGKASEQNKKTAL